jgi:Na+/melibiose symporter-like transporter
MKAKTKATKFPLLIYQRYHQVQRGRSVMWLFVGIVLAVVAALFGFLGSNLVGGDVWKLFWAGIVLAVFGLIRFLFTWVLSRIPYVQCTPRTVKIQTPFMPVVFSYKRIENTRPNNIHDVFPPQKQKGERKKMLETLWGETAIVVDLKGYPMSKSLLRTVLGPYLLTPKGTGFVFLVKDWMTLSRQLSDYQEQWRTRTSTTAAQRGSQ